MKINKLCLGGFLLFVLLGFFAVGTANAQFPDLSQWENQWFKLTVKSKGVLYNGLSMKTENNNSIIYLNIVKFNPPAELTGVLWEKNDEYKWVEGGEIKIKVIGGTDLDFLCAFMVVNDSLTNPEVIGFSARVTGRTVKGALTSGKFKSLGGFTWEQNLSLNSNYFASGLTITGNLIDQTLLPFNPEP